MRPRSTCDTCGKSKANNAFPVVDGGSLSLICRGCMSLADRLAAPVDRNDKACSRCGEVRPWATYATEAGRSRGVCRICRIEQDKERARRKALAGDWGVPESKHCNRCDKTKPSSEFGLRVGRADNLQAKCKRCQSLAWRANKYGIAPEEYERMEEEQGFACAICGEASDSLRVDHNHDTGRVRALLCHNCNAGIGLLKDNPDLVMHAAIYLLQHSDVLGVKN